MKHKLTITRNDITGVWSAELIGFDDLPFNKQIAVVEANSYPELQVEMSELISKVNNNYNQ